MTAMMTPVVTTISTPRTMTAIRNPRMPASQADRAG